MRAAVPEQPLTTTVKSLKNATKSPIVTPAEVISKPYDNVSNRASDSYQHLWLAFTEEDEKFEYSLRYNSSRSGFWLASQPHTRKPCLKSHFSDYLCPPSPFFPFKPALFSFSIYLLPFLE